MSDEIYQLISIFIYLAVMLYIGWYSYKRTSNLTDYMLGGRSLGPAVTALSAGAADMSGWLLMGLPGGIYVTGLADAWIAIGLTLGAYANWFFIAPRLRSYSQVANDSITIPGYLENRFKDSSKLLRIVSGLVILVFFTFYISSGMVSGGVFFESSFGIDYKVGLFIVGGVTIAYTLFGGFLAVSYTDFLQGLMMLIALLLVPIIGIFFTGGPAETFNTIRAVDPTLLDFFKGTTFVGIVSALAWGLGYFGQPHIIVRFMAINSIKETKSARRIGMGWMIFSLLGTISSQLIVTSSALIEDLYKVLLRKNRSDREYVLLGRMAVLLVSIIAMVLALEPDSSILDLVAYAWAGFGGAFGPVILLSLFWRKMTNWGALAGMITGAVTVILWANLTEAGVIPFQLYEIVPGFLINLFFIIVVSLITYKPNETIEKEFDETVRLLKSEQ
jgi:sodium/proline symporter